MQGVRQDRFATSSRHRCSADGRLRRGSHPGQHCTQRCHTGTRHRCCPACRHSCRHRRNPHTDLLRHKSTAVSRLGRRETCRSPSHRRRHRSGSPPRGIRGQREPFAGHKGGQHLAGLRLQHQCLAGNLPQANRHRLHRYPPHLDRAVVVGSAGRRRSTGPKAKRNAKGLSSGPGTVHADSPPR